MTSRRDSTPPKDVASGTENEDTDVEEAEVAPTTLQGTVIEDLDPQYIDADEDLAAEFPDDTESLELVHLKIRSMAALHLERFTKLKLLVLRQNLLGSMGEVKKLNDSVEEVDLYDNRIKHISSHINEKTRLQRLDLSFNKIRTIQNLGQLVELEELFFVQNKIEEIKGLENLVNVKNLELGGNRVAKIENLDTLVNLTELWLGKNRITKFENLDSLVNLKILSIQSNRITKLQGLDSLVNLEELYLSHNGIEKIEGLENNLKLTTLDITRNRITKLEGLSHLHKLTDLWASYNHFDSFQDVENELKDLKELDTVYFEGNPLQLQNPTSYRRKVILFLPQVNKIDSTYVR